jgi:hypothetical protein
VSPIFNSPCCHNRLPMKHEHFIRFSLSLKTKKALPHYPVLSLSHFLVVQPLLTNEILEKEPRRFNRSIKALDNMSSLSCLQLDSLLLLLNQSTRRTAPSFEVSECKTEYHDRLNIQSLRKQQLREVFKPYPANVENRVSS